jgi:hypothetical protein
MYDLETRRNAFGLMQRGYSLRATSLQTGISSTTLRYWRDHPEMLNPRPQSICPRCAPATELPEPAGEYAYVLGLYLGDGCINLIGDPRKGVWVLRIACADVWPGLLEECKRAVHAIRPANKVGTVQSIGCSYVVCSSRHWPCFFPQHGSGRKHLREIELQPWQRMITRRHPGSL